MRKVAVWLRKGNAHLLRIPDDVADRWRWPKLIGQYTLKKRRDGSHYIVGNDGRRYTIEPYNAHDRTHGPDGARYVEIVSQP